LEEFGAVRFNRVKMYEGIFKSPADVHVEFWDYTFHRVGDVFWAVARERGTYPGGGAVKGLNIRTSNFSAW
jgi:hypothetical protein